MITENYMLSDDILLKYRNANSKQKGYILEDILSNYLHSNEYIQVCNVVGSASTSLDDSPSGDGGKDFRIVIKENIETPVIFNTPVIAGKTYYVEVKFSNHIVQYSRLAPNLSQTQNSGVEGVFVVTNSYFGPAAFNKILNNYPPLKGKITVIRGYMFRSLLPEDQQQILDAIGVVSDKNDETKEIYASKHINTFRSLGKSMYTFYFAFYNNSDRDEELELMALTENNWEYCLTDKDIDFNERKVIDHLTEILSVNFYQSIFLPAKSSTTLRLYARPINSGAAQNVIIDGRRIEKADNAKICIRYGETEEILIDNLKAFEIQYKIPFTGKDNLAKKTLLKNEVKTYLSCQDSSKAKFFQIIHLYGKAGVGKSRVLEEIFTEFDPDDAYSHYKLLIHTIPSATEQTTSSSQSFDGIKKVLKDSSSSIAETEWIKSIYSAETLLDRLFIEFNNMVFYSNNGTIFLILEDLHHANEELCIKISDLITQSPAIGYRLVLVLTARNDDSYVNDHYKSLHMQLLRSDNVISHEINELEEEETIKLIGEVIRGIQPSGIERIYRLCGNIPQHILQCVEYLMDSTLLELDIRNTLSIIDMYTFEVRSQSFPESIEELFLQRLKSLLLWKDYGKIAMNALMSATAFGTKFPAKVCAYGAGADDAVLETVKKELISRNFFRSISKKDDKFLEWSHENVLIHFRNFRQLFLQGVLNSEALEILNDHFYNNAAALYSEKALFNDLPEYVKGDIAVLNNDFDTAYAIFAPIIDFVSECNSFITFDTKTVYYDHIESVVSMLFADKHDNRHELLWKLLCLKAYIGGVNLGLSFMLIAMTYAKHALQKYQLKEDYKMLSDFWLKLIYAHVHLDSGFIGKAMEQFMNLQAAVKLSSLEDSDIEFELNNCMRLIYIYTNFYSLADSHGKLCLKAVEESSDNYFKNMDLCDRAFMTQLIDREQSITMLQEALALKGSKRHKWHSEASLISCEIYDSLESANGLKQLKTRTEYLLNECNSKRYYSILPRLYLMVAALEYLIGCADKDSTAEYFERAVKTAELGLGVTECYSIGFISWQIRNLIAVIEYRRSMKKTAKEHMESAVKALENDGLTFVGNGKVISAVPIVYANYLKLNIGTATLPKKVADLLAKLHGFELYKWHKINRDDYLKHVNRYHHIIFENKEMPDGLIIDKPTNLAVPIWF